MLVVLLWARILKVVLDRFPPWSGIFFNLPGVDIEDVCRMQEFKLIFIASNIITNGSFFGRNHWLKLTVISFSFLAWKCRHPYH